MTSRLALLSEDLQEQVHAAVIERLGQDRNATVSAHLRSGSVTESVAERSRHAL